MPVIQGIEQFEAKLNKLSLAVNRKVLTIGGKDAVEVVRKGAMDAAPVLTGALAADPNEVISVVQSQSNAYYVLFRIGPSRKVFYGGFDEWGTAHQEAEPWLGPSFVRTKILAEDRLAGAFKEALENI